MEAIKSQLDSVLAKLESNEALISDVKSMKEAGEEFRKSLSAETAKLNEKADALQAQLDGVDARTQAGFASAAMTDYRDTQTMGVGAHDIQEAKAECEASGKECKFIWGFEEKVVDYEQ